MNGTVTMSTAVTGVEADDFRAAVNRVKAHPAMLGATIVADSPSEFSYTLPGGISGCFGTMSDKPLRMMQ